MFGTGLDVMYTWSIRCKLELRLRLEHRVCMHAKKLYLSMCVLSKRQRLAIITFTRITLAVRSI